ncbi:MAG TPA: flippase-like domain-containing protein [Solirubrobacteraceae bacterium]
MANLNDAMPDELSPRHLRRGLLQLAGVGVAVLLVVLVGPGLDSVRDRIGDASPWWLAAAVVFELLSALSYVVVFRSVFCAQMSWRLSYQIGMSEQGANSLLPAGGAGGLALGAWALNRGGMSAAHIGRRTVAFFLLTSLANVGALVVFAALFAAGLLSGDTDPALTYGFGAASVVAIVVTLLVPVMGTRLAPRGELPADAGRVRVAIRHVRSAIGDGVRDSIVLLRRRSPGVLGGSLGYLGFDIAVLVCCFHAFGQSPELSIVVVAYIIGQLGGLVPLPGGIGGTEGGLIGAFALYHVPLAAATVAVLTYRALALWLPALLGSVAFVRLRATLARETKPAAMCGELAAPLPKPRSATRARGRSPRRPIRS